MFDDIFEYIGDFDTYQVVLYMLLGMTSFYGGYEVIALTFLGAAPDYWCKVGGINTWEDEGWRGGNVMR